MTEPAETFVLAATAGHRARAEALLVAHPEIEPDRPNFRGVVGGSPEGTLLHHAAWVANADLVAKLLAAGADPAARADASLETPLGWAALASSWQEGRDHVAVAKLLVEAGNEIEPRFLDVAEGPLYDWLAARA